MAKIIKITGGRYIGTSGENISQRRLKKMIDEELSREQRYRNQQVQLTPQSRTEGIIDESSLKQLRIFIWGAGGVGSRVELHMSPYCGEITCADFDKIDASNVQGGRTPYAAQDIGMLKVTALGEMILRKNPGITYTPIYRNYSDFSDDEIRQYAAMSDLMIWGIDDIEALLRGDELTHGQTMSLFPAGHVGIRSGHIAISRPGEACFRHILGVESAEEMQTLHREPGLGLDFEIIALWTVKVALALFSPATSELSRLFDENHNFIFINNRLSPEEYTRSIHREKHRTCPICNR